MLLGTLATELQELTERVEKKAECDGFSIAADKPKVMRLLPVWFCE